MNRQNPDLKELLNYPDVPEDVHNDILLTCMALPQKERKPGFFRPLKAAGISLCSVAAAFVLLFGINAANPVFAESIPLLGSLFQRYNDQYKVVVGSHIDSYDGVETVDLTTSSNSYTFTLLESYSDGEFLHFSYQMTAPESYLTRYDSIYADAALTVNGKEYEPIELFFFPEDAKFSGTGSVKLDQPAADGDSLAVSLALTGGTGRLAEDLQEFEDLDPIELSASFQVTADTSHNRSFGEFSGSGDVAVLSAEATPSYTRIECETPFWGIQGGTIVGTDPKLYLPDGTELKRSPQSCQTPYPEDLSEDTDRVQSTFQFDGAPQGTETLILRFYAYDDVWAEGHEKVISELTIDLKNKSYSPSSTYLDAGEEGLEDLTHAYDFAKYDLVTDVLQNRKSDSPEGLAPSSREDIFRDDSLFENDLLLKTLHVQKDGKVRVLLYDRSESYRPMKFELLLNGEVIASQSTTEDSLFQNDFKAFYTEEEAQNQLASLKNYASEEDLELLQQDTPGQNVYSFKTQLSEGCSVPVPSDLTVRVTDSGTGDLLYEKEISMTRMYFFSGSYDILLD